jgi:hypothetical protein
MQGDTQVVAQWTKQFLKVEMEIMRTLDDLGQTNVIQGGQGEPTETPMIAQLPP